MIGFLYPALGLAALAAAIPVILHLIRRREVRRVSFPAIRYLRQAEQRHARRLRLRHLLLLASRVLIILLLAAAAAGPLVGRGGPTDHHATAVAIVIDDSQSGSVLVGERRVIDLYAERLGLTLELATAEDRLATFSAVRPDQGAILSRSAAARDYLTELRPAAGMADLAGAVREAVTWLRAQDGLERELHILTDLQAISLPGRDGMAADSADPGKAVTAIVFTPEFSAEANGAVVDVMPEALPLTAGREARVAVAIQWFGAEAPDDAAVVRLIAGAEVVAATEARYGETALLTLPAQAAGWVQGYAEIDGRGLSADDRRYFSWLVRPAPMVATSGDPGAFVESALRTLERGKRLSRVTARASEVVVAANGDGIEAALAAGRSVIILPPSDPLDLPRLNLRLERARIPWRYRADRPGRGATRIAAAASLSGLGGLEVHRAYGLALSGRASDDTALAQVESGEAWLVRGTTPEGSVYLLFASPLTAEDSDLPVSAAMVPVLDAIVGDWARRDTPMHTTYEGPTTIRIPTRARALVDPDGLSRSVEGGSLFEAAQAGNYLFREGDLPVLAFSLNAPALESDLRRGEVADLRRMLPDADWVATDARDAEGWVRAIYRARRGRLAWRPLVVLLILASIVEASLATAGRRQVANARDAGSDETRQIQVKSL